MKKLLTAFPLVLLSLLGCEKVDPLEGTSARATAGTADSHATSKHTVPIKGSFVTSANPVANEPGDPAGTVRLVVTGTGQASHLGKASYEDHTLLDPVAGTATGTHTITAANGDQIFAILHVVLTPLENGTSIVAVHFDITGGTGRFTGATGYYDGLDILNPASPAGSLTIAGQISY
jgi:hypothetical protein